MSGSSLRSSRKSNRRQSELFGFRPALDLFRGEVVQADVLRPEDPGRSRMARRGIADIMADLVVVRDCYCHGEIDLDQEGSREAWNRLDGDALAWLARKSKSSVGAVLVPGGPSRPVDGSEGSGGPDGRMDASDGSPPPDPGIPDSNSESSETGSFSESSVIYDDLPGTVLDPRD